MSALRAERRGFPLMNLQDGKKLESNFVGAGSTESFAVAGAEARALVNADLNADGAQDLIVGYASGGDGGHLAVY